MSVNRFRLLIGLLAVLSFAEGGQERLRLERADRLENIVRDGITVQILTRNVVFTKGPVVVVCDRAEYREKTGQGFMTGNVVVTKRSQNLTCDSLHYDSPRDLLNAYGRAHAWDEDYNLTADTLKFYTELDSGVAAGSVHFIQKKQDIRSDRIAYVKPEGETAARYLVSGNVVITEEDRTAYCGEAYYSPDPEFMELRLTPRLVDNDRTLEGEQIRLEYARDKLKNLFIPERAHVTTETRGFRETTVDSDSVAVREPFTATDDLTGNRLNGFFVDGQLDSLRLEGMATTLYHIYDDSVYQGKNLSSGDTVIMTFGTGELKDIYIIGGSEGVYTPDAGQGDLEGPIKYSSESIRYNLPRKQTDLFQSGAIQYEDTNLKAGYILVDWNRNLLFAYPRVPGDSLAPALRPILLEAGREPMEGDTMVYNLKSRQGKVLQGWTKAQDGFYTGREIRNQGNDALFVENSVYTTCDLDEPHFHFGSSEMKLIQHDKVVARPLILYIAGIPVLGLPFAIFPNKGGQRHSGWIMPSYGESSNRGQFIDGLGYYWASSPYWDTRITLSFADRQGVTIKSRTPYRKRYRFSGNFYLETRQKLGSGEQDITQITKNRKTDYIVKWNHRQQMRHNQNFNVNAAYYSNGEYNRNTGLDPLNRMNQQAISNATYSKRWPKHNNSVSINLSSRRDLMAERRIDSTSVFYQVPKKSGQEINQDTRTLPGLTFRHGQSPVLPGKWGAAGPLKNTTWSYSMNLRNKERTYFRSIPADSGSGFVWDYASPGSPNLQYQSDQIINHSISLNSPQKVFRYITVNPQLSLKSDWVNRSFTATLDSNGQLVRKEVFGLAMRTTGSFNLRTNTQIYGLFPVHIGALRGLRHVMSPSINFRYTPDFSKPVFGSDLGYVETLIDSSGGKQINDRFSGTLAGGTPTREVKAIGLAVNNVFQAKVLKDDKVKKLDLFSWSLSTNYNSVAKQFPLSNLQSSIRTRLTKGINLDLTMSHDFYAWDDSLNQRAQNIRRGSGGVPVPRLLKVNLSTAFRFSGKRIAGTAAVDTTASNPDSTGEDLPEAYKFSNKLGDVGRPIEGGQLWSTSLSFRYSLNNTNPANPVKTFWMNSNTTLQLTRAWRIKYTARFDLIKRSLVSQGFSLYRDLHCWEMSINWTPNGYGQGFYLKINVKSPNLKDLKLEQRGGVFKTVPNF